MTTKSPPNVDLIRSNYIALTPRSAKFLSVVAIGAMYAWFTLKLFLASDRVFLSLTVGCLALIGMIASMTLFLCTYSYIANAPEHGIDERELSQRNEAYFRAYQYAVSVLLVGSIGSEAAEHYGYAISSGVFRNFLLLCFTTFLIFPTTFLIWNATEED